jgi:hypothetical protein
VGYTEDVYERKMNTCEGLIHRIVDVATYVSDENTLPYVTPVEQPARICTEAEGGYF